MRRKTSIILALLLLLVGIGVLIYPTLSDYVNRINGSYAIQEMNNQLAQVERETITRQRRLAEDYNAGLSGVAITDAFTAEEDDTLLEGYNGIMDLGNGIMGSIQIPKIDVSLPIYHGVDSVVLSKGVGHMPQTAFPIGGSGNHAVLTGHTGLPTAGLFTDLTKMELGDLFYINILEDTIAYQVDQIKVVLPHESEDLRAVPGKDYCTLVTCTPYGINSHRLLVRGIRIELEEEVIVQQMQAEIRTQTSVPVELMAAGASVLVVLITIIVLVFKKNKE